MKETLVIANNPIMWILALIIIANVVVHSSGCLCWCQTLNR